MDCVTLCVLFGVLFAALNGCIAWDQKKFIENRLECVDLASQSYAIVPECSTQQKCFSLLESGLFDFSLSEFDFDVRQEIFHYKNHIAKAWLYYNRALANTENIRKICQSGEDVAVLPSQLNELNNNLRISFREADKANELSVKILLLEKHSLGGMRIAEAKEEELFDVFIEINNNLNQYGSSGTLQGSDSYAAVLRKNTEKFNSLSDEKGFSKIVLREFSAVDLFSDVSRRGKESLLEGEEKKDFFVPFFSDYFDLMNSFFWRASKLNEGIQEFYSFPTFEFLNVYSDIAGARDSVLEEFSLLLRKNASARTALSKKISSLEEKTESKISGLREKLESVSFSSLDGTEELLLSLDSGSAAAFGVREMSMDSLEEARKELRSKIEKMERSFRTLASGGIPAGERMKSLKALDAELSETQKAVDFISSELVEQMAFLCEERILSSEKTISGLADANGSKETAPLLSAVRLSFKEFWEEESVCGRIEKCGIALRKFSAFLRAESAFSSRMEEEAKRQFLRESEILEGKLAECREMLFALEKVGSQKAARLRESFHALEEDFIKGNNESVQGSVEELLRALGEELRASITEFLSSSCSIRQITETVPKLGRPYSTRFSVSLTNSIYPLDEPVSISIPWTDGQQIFPLEFKTGNVIGVQYSGSALLVRLDSLPLGITRFDFSAEKNLEFSGEEELLSASWREAIFLRKIVLDDSEKPPRINAFFDLNRNSLHVLEARVLSESRIIPCSLRDSELSFCIENPRPGQKIEIFYSLENPLAVSPEFISSEEIDFNLSRNFYSLSVKNRLDFEIAKADIAFPLDVPEFVEGGTVREAGGKKASVSLSGKIALFSLSRIKPLEERTLFFELVLRDESAYYKRMLEEIKSDLYELTASQIQRVRDSAGELLEAALSFGKIGPAAEIEELIELRKRKDALFAENRVLEDAIAGFFEKKERVEQLLSEADTALEISRSFDKNFVSEEISKKISSAGEFFAAAMTEFETQDINSAADSLEKSALALDFNSANFNSMLIEWTDSILESMEEVYARALDLNAPSAPAEMKRRKLLLLKAEVEESVSRGRILEAIKRLSALLGHSRDFNAWLAGEIEKSSPAIEASASKEVEAGLVPRGEDAEISLGGEGSTVLPSGYFSIFDMSSELLPLAVPALLALAVIVYARQIRRKKSRACKDRLLKIIRRH